MTSEQKFQTDNDYRLHRLRHFAKKYGWKELKYLVFTKEKTILKIDNKKLMFISSLLHPVRGYSTLSRIGEFTQKNVESIFRNPRQHTGKKIKSEYICI